MMDPALHALAHDFNSEFELESFIVLKTYKLIIAKKCVPSINYFTMQYAFVGDVHAVLAYALLPAFSCPPTFIFFNFKTENKSLIKTKLRYPA
jgi:hypothetical protein